MRFFHLIILNIKKIFFVFIKRLTVKTSHLWLLLLSITAKAINASEVKSSKIDTSSLIRETEEAISKAESSLQSALKYETMCIRQNKDRQTLSKASNRVASVFERRYRLYKELETLHKNLEWQREKAWLKRTHSVKTQLPLK